MVKIPDLFQLFKYFTFLKPTLYCFLAGHLVSFFYTLSLHVWFLLTIILKVFCYPARKRVNY